MLRGPHTKTISQLSESPLIPKFTQFSRDMEKTTQQICICMCRAQIGIMTSVGIAHITQQGQTLLCTADDLMTWKGYFLQTLPYRHSRDSACLSEFIMSHRMTPTGTATTCRPQCSGSARSIPQLTGANTTSLGRDTRSGCSRPTLPVGRADHPVNLAALA